MNQKYDNDESWLQGDFVYIVKEKPKQKLPCFRNLEDTEESYLLGESKVNLQKYEKKPRITVKTRDGIYLYVYKLDSGECWFEYEPSQQKEVICPLKTIDDQDNFIKNHIDEIIDPNKSVRSYLHQRNLLQAFNILNLIFEMTLVIYFHYRYKDAIAHLEMGSSYFQKWKFIGQKLKTNEIFIISTILNSFALLFGFYTILNHSKSLYKWSKLLMVLSLIFRLAACRLNEINALSSIPRVLLLFHIIFVGNCLLPRALIIKTGQNYYMKRQKEQTNSTVSGVDRIGFQDQEQGQNKKEVFTQIFQKQLDDLNFGQPIKEERNMSPLYNEFQRASRNSETQIKQVKLGGADLRKPKGILRGKYRN